MFGLIEYKRKKIKIALLKKSSVWIERKYMGVRKMISIEEFIIFIGANVINSIRIEG